METSGTEKRTDGPIFAGSAASAPVRASLLPWALAAGLVLLGGGGLLWSNQRQPAHANEPAHSRQNDRYAQQVKVGNLAMSESTSLSGGKSTYIDGHVRNVGNETIVAMKVQVSFANDEGAPPHLYNLPLTLIRTRQPYVDTEPVSAEPLKPGEDREFRLIFEQVTPSWNQQEPQIHVMTVFTACTSCT